MSTGVSPGTFKSDEDVYKFQYNLASLQLLLENYLIEKAKTEDRHTVILCDRSLLDGKAYMDEQLWYRMLDELGLDESKICNRYDAVIFLRTSAWGAEEAYNAGQKDNKVRYEDAEAARQTDKRILDCWSIHHKIRIIANEEVFEDKCRNVLKAVERVMGVPMPLNHRRKYLLSGLPTIPPSIKTVDFFIEQTFIQSNDPSLEVRLIRRKQNGKNTYTLYTKRVRNGENNKDKIETERSLTDSLYNEFLMRADPTRSTLVIRRKCFLMGNQFFKVDEYCNIHTSSGQTPGGFVILQLSTDEDPSTIEFPPFVDIVRDVTEDDAYSSFKLAEIAGPPESPTVLENAGAKFVVVDGDDEQKKL
eukprot:GEZU01020705.1.p1 GENE.GEZU01020705.1~~GEZU01020705.1.p1  ORF type:complete len:361 (-),score=120.29 GEZU01020705.1:33-1115(-)